MTTPMGCTIKKDFCRLLDEGAPEAITAIKVLKREFKEKLEAKKRASKPPAPPPISLYDDIYFEGLKTLDELAGESIASAQGIVEFSDDIWESRRRHGYKDLDIG